jgi:hypothetical protein
VNDAIATTSPSAARRRTGDDLAAVDHPPFRPNAQQIRYLEKFMDPELKPWNIKTVAAAARVHRRQVYRWMENPQFCAWFKEETDRVFRHALPKMWARCMELAIQGSPEHIKLIGLRTGELRAEAQSVNGERASITNVFVNVPRPHQLEPAGDVLDIAPAIFPVEATEQ